MRTLFSQIVTIGAMILTVTSAAACERCCARCGKAEAGNKVCRLESVDKKVMITCWSCETEDICLPGPSKRTCHHCDVACDEFCDHCHADWRRYFMWSEWTPRGHPMIVTKRKLMKKTVAKKVPSYKWVVEDLCAECEAGCEAVTVPDGVAIPPAPSVEGAKTIGVQPNRLERSN